VRESPELIALVERMTADRQRADEDGSFGMDLPT
jgi:hypothetical protein